MLYDPVNDDPNILQSSPAIDSGIEYENSLSGNLDYLGNERIVNNLIDIGAVEFGNITSVSFRGSNTINTFKLLAAYPNPFNTSSIITFKVSFQNLAEKYFLKIYDILGRKPVSKEYNSNGNEQVFFHWDSGNYERGIYFVEVKSSITLARPATAQAISYSPKVFIDKFLFTIIPSM